MAFCSNCGSQLPEGSKFCGVCGNYVQPNNAQPQFQFNGAQQPGKAPIPEANTTPDPKDAAENKIYAVLAYLGILVLIPLLTDKAKKSPFARFHTAQGSVLFLISCGISLLPRVVYTLTDLYAWSTISNVFSIAVLVLQIIGIVYAAQGTLKPLPLIGEFALKAFKGSNQ